jgi:serine/threonine-protein kinase
MTTGSFSTAHLTALTTALADRYRLERALGAGGMATVWLAADLRHERRVAIKVLHPELSAALGTERFLAEIKTTANLQHPHILPLFDSGAAEGLLYYVMPFVEGETLRARLERERQLPVADAVRIATEVAGALDYAHRRGVVHRDVKPENILLQGVHALVADFGIALAVQHAGGQRMTQTGLSLGTPQYMAPEQAMGERAVDARADIFALGAVTYEMLAGEPPFVGPSAQAIVARVMTEQPRPLTVQRRSVPTHVAVAVHRALEKLPADRFAADEFSAALATPASAARTTAAWAAPVRRRRVLLAMTAVGLVALTGAAWTWATRASDGGSAAPRAGARPWIATLTFPDSAALVGPFALAPDGSRLVYVARRPGGTQLWIRDADALQPRPLPGTEGAYYPAISPDGGRVAFLAGRALRVVSLNGGPVTTVTDTLKTFAPIQWDGDDDILLPAGGGIMRIPVRGGAWERVTTVDPANAEVFHTGPVSLPGGRAILFIVVPRNYSDNALFRVAVSDRATGRHKTIMPGYAAHYVEPGYLLVVPPDSSLIAVPFDAARGQATGTPVVLSRSVTILSNGQPQVAVAPTGQLVYATGVPEEARVNLARVRRDGTATLLDSAWTGDVDGIAVSRTGTHVAAALDLGSRDILVRDLRSGALTRVTTPGLVTHDPAFAPDGRTVYFTTSSPAASTLHAAVLGGTAAARVILRDTLRLFAEPALAPDGRTLYYAYGRGGQWDIRAHVLDGNADRDRVLVATPARELSPTPSPDGRWLAYSSDDEGRREVYVRSTDAARAERWPVSVGGGSMPRWSRDGRELFYFGRDSLMAAQVASGGDFGIGTRRALFSLAPFSTETGAYDVLPGDEGFLMLRKREEGAAGRQLVFLDHWQALVASARASR